jgi:hypothetical protein
MPRSGTWTETSKGGGGWEPIAGVIAVLAVLVLGAKVITVVSVAVAAVVTALMWAGFAIVVLGAGSAFGYLIWRMRHPRELPFRPYQPQVRYRPDYEEVTQTRRPAAGYEPRRPLPPAGQGRMHPADVQALADEIVRQARGQ